MTGRTLADSASAQRAPDRCPWAATASRKVSRAPTFQPAEREGMDRAYVSRMVNLTTLAPDIVAAILDETLPPEVTLFDLASGTPLLWDEQRARLSAR